MWCLISAPIVLLRTQNGGEKYVISSRSESCALLPRAYPRARHHRDPHAGARHRRQRRHLYAGAGFTWTDPVIKFIPGFSAAPYRIVGVAADVDDEHVVPGPTLTVYHPFEVQMYGGNMFVHTHSDPHALAAPITRIIRDMSADEPVEHAATLQGIRAEVLTPDRLNSLVSGVFAAVALVIAVVGVAGVLAFSVSSRAREFGIRLALGSLPGHLLKAVIAEGTVMAAAGVAAGTAFGYILARLAGSYFPDVKMPGATPVVTAALVMLAAAVVASTLPAARAARVNVVQALHSD